MLTHFDLLWNDLAEIRKKAALLESPNPQDDRMVKLSMVGYSYHRPIASWGCDEYEILASRRRDSADLGPRWVEFVCLVSGYLLGMHQAGRCSDTEYARLEAQLPGFMWLHSERFVEPKST
jgi:hypothetical protein